VTDWISQNVNEVGEACSWWLARLCAPAEIELTESSARTAHPNHRHRGGRASSSGGPRATTKPCGRCARTARCAASASSSPWPMTRWLGCGRDDRGGTERDAAGE